jgi:uncharacterized protein (TIGR02145 family)/uncharacterized repeat protein (TIGR02543 family)
MPKKVTNKKEYTMKRSILRVIGFVVTVAALFMGCEESASPNNSGLVDGFLVRVNEKPGEGAGTSMRNVTVSSIATDAKGSGNYVVGQTVFLEAGTAPALWPFDKWTTTSPGVNFADTNKASTRFDMPANDVTVTAVFRIYSGWGDTLTDTRDGNKKYWTTIIGGKMWMAENLSYQTGNSWCYDNDSNKCNTYGRLYDWNTAAKVCPSGWKLPAVQDWDNLIMAAGGYDLAGKKLKARSGWSEYNGQSANGTDDYGFSAMPGGRYMWDYFQEAGHRGYWWTDTEYNDSVAYSQIVFYDGNNMFGNGNTVGKGYGFSVRCIAGESTANEYRLTITFNGNGGTVSPASGATDTTGKLASLPTPTMSGYEFKGWFTAMANGDSITASEIFTDNITIYARWTAISYAITYNLNNGTNNASNPSSYTIESSAITLNSPSMDGYTFGGWYSDSIFTGNAVMSIPAGSTGSITYWAKWISTTTPNGDSTFIDIRDDKKYKMVRIGYQTWMSENLNYDTANGAGSWCYGNSADNCVKYGRLYNWGTAMGGALSSTANPSGVRGICPDGWHLPSRGEWNNLAVAAGGYSQAGKKLKSTSGWNSNGNGTDDLGFSALPGGGRNTVGNFSSVAYYGFWWTAEEFGSDSAYYRFMYYDNDLSSVYDVKDRDKSNAFSVRCVMNE